MRVSRKEIEVIKDKFENSFGQGRAGGAGDGGDGMKSPGQRYL